LNLKRMTELLSLCRRHRDRVVRRGLAMMIESDFYACASLQLEIAL